MSFWSQSVNILLKIINSSGIIKHYNCERKKNLLTRIATLPMFASLINTSSAYVRMLISPYILTETFHTYTFTVTSLLPMQYTCTPPTSHSVGLYSLPVIYTHTLYSLSRPMHSHAHAHGSQYSRPVRTYTHSHTYMHTRSLLSPMQTAFTGSTRMDIFAVTRTLVEWPDLTNVLYNLLSCYLLESVSRYKTASNISRANHSDICIP